MVNENVLTLSYGKIKEKNLDNGGLMPESFETYQIVKPGDIILRLTDLQNDKTSLRVGHSNFEGIITSAYVDISSANYKSKYLYYLLHAYDLMKVFYNLGAGLRQGMKFSDLKRLPAFGVEQDEQQQIIDYLESYERKTDELKQKIQTQITLLRERRTSLISHAVTGKVKIT
jgi:type I restriction enzyme S subunit